MYLNIIVFFSNKLMNMLPPPPHTHTHTHKKKVTDPLILFLSFDPTDEQTPIDRPRSGRVILMYL